MTEIEEASPEYIKGFNEGYLLAKDDPSLAEKLASAMPNTDRGNAFKKGIEEFTKEVEKDKLPKWLQKDRLNRDKDDKNNKDLERD